MRIPNEVIVLANEGGYGVDMFWFESLPEYAHAQFLIDINFWQSLGKRLGWKYPDSIDSDYCLNGEWVSQASECFYLTLTNSDTAPFWEDIIKSK